MKTPQVKAIPGTGPLGLQRPSYTRTVIALDAYLKRWEGLCMDDNEDRATLAHALVRDGIVPHLAEVMPCGHVTIPDPDRADWCRVCANIAEQEGE